MIIIDLLSKREQTVLRWLIEGLRDKDIGPLLGLSSRSATRVVREICDKLNARTRTQAACMFLAEQKAKIGWEMENPSSTLQHDRGCGIPDANLLSSRGFCLAGISDGQQELADAFKKKL